MVLIGLVPNSVWNRRLYVDGSVKGKSSWKMWGASPKSTLNISVARHCKFRWWIETELSLFSSSSKVDNHYRLHRDIVVYCLVFCSETSKLEDNG